MPIEQAAADTSTNALVEHFFRHEFGKVVAHLCRVFGTSNIELIEDSVQDALFKAMQVWPYNEVPANPGGWIARAAKNRVIDRLRHENRNVSVAPESYEALPNNAQQANTDQVLLDTDFEDDQLRLIFTCCHPTLSKESQLTIILKLLCGFSVPEISRALLKKEEAISKAVTRAKARLKSVELQQEDLSATAIKERLNTVLHVIYLLFNEGYKAAGGDALIRKDLCVEAIRLNDLILKNKFCQESRTHALMALQCYQASRLDARLDENGFIIPFKDQDRSRWNQQLIALGNYHLTHASTANDTSFYLIQADIAALYSRSTSFENTNWKAILFLHDLLGQATASPMAALNRVVPFAQVHGPQAGLAELEKLAPDQRLSEHHLFYAIKAELFLDLQQTQAAIPELERAIALAKNTAERGHLQRKLEQAKQTIR